MPHFPQHPPWGVDLPAPRAPPIRTGPKQLNFDSTVVMRRALLRDLEFEWLQAENSPKQSRCSYINMCTGMSKERSYVSLLSPSFNPNFLINCCEGYFIFRWITRCLLMPKGATSWRRSHRDSDVDSDMWNKGAYFRFELFGNIDVALEDSNHLTQRFIPGLGAFSLSLPWPRPPREDAHDLLSRCCYFPSDTGCVSTGEDSKLTQPPY